MTEKLRQTCLIISGLEGSVLSPHWLFLLLGLAPVSFPRPGAPSSRQMAWVSEAPPRKQGSSRLQGRPLDMERGNALLRFSWWVGKLVCGHLICPGTPCWP